MAGLPTPTDGDTALITGASSGIGAEIAKQLAQRGQAVTLVARRRERLQKLADELAAAHGVRTDVLPADLTDPDARAQLPDRVKELGLHVAVLVNNAGFGTSGYFNDADLDKEIQQVRILVEAVVDLTRRFVPAMVERREGAILNVASTAGFAPLPRMAGYGAAKAWSRSFSHAIHHELASRNIAVTALCPGPVETEFFEVTGPTPIENVVPKPAWIDAELAARTGVEGLERNRAEVVPGRAMKAIIAAGRFTPQEIRGPLLSRFFR